MLLANGLVIFAIKDNPVFSNGLKRQPKNPPDCSNLCNVVFDNFTLAEELLAKASQSLESCVLVKNNFFRTFFSSLELPITFDEIFKVTSVLLFIPDFNLLDCELDVKYVILSHFILILY